MIIRTLFTSQSQGSAFYCGTMEVFGKHVLNRFSRRIYFLRYKDRQAVLDCKTTEDFRFPFFRRRGSDDMFLSSGFERVLPIFVCGFSPSFQKHD